MNEKKKRGRKRKSESSEQSPPKKRVGLMYLTETEVNAFMEVVDEPRDKVIFLLMLRQGLRVGEVVGEDLDYWTRDGHRIKNEEIPSDHEKYPHNKDIEIGNNVFVHIVHSLPGIHLEDIDWQEKQMVVRGKGDKTRLIPLRDDVMKELIEFVQPTKFDPKDRVGKMFDIDPPSVRYQCRKYSKKANLQRRIHPHIFRHTFAVNYLKMGGNVVALQRLLGHSSLAMTEKYLQLVPDDIRRDLDKVSINETMTKDPSQAKKELAEKIAGAITGG
jgi:site-specific recombinase XerD